MFCMLVEMFDEIYSKISNCSRQRLNNLFPFLSNYCEIFLISSLAFYVLDPCIVSIRVLSLFHEQVCILNTFSHTWQSIFNSRQLEKCYY